MNRIAAVCPLLFVIAACSSQSSVPRQAAHRPVTDVAPGRADIGGASVNLPARIGDWTRPDAAKRVTAESIFDYMDGAGELYLAYRFDHLDVFEYKPADAAVGTILVEIYSMKDGQDAFGLLSNDWGGEPVPFDFGAGPFSLPSVLPRRALYGAGLLRMWVGDRYVRILASRESQDSREAVLRLGREITTPGTGVSNVKWPPPPGLLRGLVRAADAKRPVRPDRTCFLRSHLVLNSQYFLASQDILGLGLDVAAGTTEYAPAAPGERPLRAIVVRYPTAQRATAALASFAKAYLPELGSRTPPQRGESKVETGWIGWNLREGNHLTIVLDAPDRQTARDAANAIVPVSDAWL